MKHIWDGARLAEVIAHSGLTKKEVADKAEISPSNITRWINNTRQPSVSALWALAKSIGVGCEMLLQPVGSPIKFEVRPKRK
ncbi:MAG: helix-turn-helix domain-containing protein [Gemmataceae bacterium]